MLQYCYYAMNNEPNKTRLQEKLRLFLNCKMHKLSGHELNEDELKRQYLRSKTIKTKTLMRLNLKILRQIK